MAEDIFDAETVRRAVAEIHPVEAEVTAFLRTREGARPFIADAGAMLIPVGSWMAAAWVERALGLALD